MTLTTFTVKVENYNSRFDDCKKFEVLATSYYINIILVDAFHEVIKKEALRTEQKIWISIVKLFLQSYHAFVHNVFISSIIM